MATFQASPALPPNAWLRWDAVVRQLPERSGSLLEIGCGQGGFAARLACRYRYVGIDLDETSVSVARRRLEAHHVPAEVRLGDLSVLAPEDRFDVVCAFEVLEHLEDDLGALRAWVDRVEPGGTLIVSVPAGPDRYASWDELAGHFRRYDAAGLLELFEQAGLTEPRATVYGWPFGYLLEGARNALARRRGADAAGGSFEQRTAASGRLLTLPDGAAAVVPYVVAKPFALVQRLQPARGTGLVASGRKPY
jgi:SAM-dependent methyltransferase